MQLIVAVLTFIAYSNPAFGADDMQARMIVEARATEVLSASLEVVGQNQSSEARTLYIIVPYSNFSIKSGVDTDAQVVYVSARDELGQTIVALYIGSDTKLPLNIEASLMIAIANSDEIKELELDTGRSFIRRTPVGIYEEINLRLWKPLQSDFLRMIDERHRIELSAVEIRFPVRTDFIRSRAMAGVEMPESAAGSHVRLVEIAKSDPTKYYSVRYALAASTKYAEIFVAIVATIIGFASISVERFSERGSFRKLAIYFVLMVVFGGGAYYFAFEDRAYALNNPEKLAGPTLAAVVVLFLFLKTLSELVSRGAEQAGAPAGQRPGSS